MRVDTQTLAEIMRAKKIRQNALAQGVDLTPTAISDMMRSGSTKESTLKKIAKFLGVDVESISDSDLSDNANMGTVSEDKSTYLTPSDKDRLIAELEAELRAAYRKLIETQEELLRIKTRENHG